MQLFRKRWQIRESGRWPWGTVLVPLLLTIIADTEANMSIHWPIAFEIPAATRERVRALLARHYSGNFRTLPFTRLCRLPHYIALYLLTDPDNPEPFYQWCSQVFGAHQTERVLLVASPDYWPLFKPEKSRTINPSDPQPSAMTDVPHATDETSSATC